MKKIGLFSSLGILFFSPLLFVSAKEEVVTGEPVAYVFGSAECEFCDNEVRWLFNEGIEFEYLHTSSSTEAQGWYEALLQKHAINKIFPLTIIGPEVIVGYEKDQVTGRDIEVAVQKAKKSDIVTIEDHLKRAPVMTPKKTVPCEGLACETTDLQTITPVPFLGLVNLHEVSKTAVAVSLGLVTIPRSVSVGWILITFGFLILIPHKKYLVIAAVLLSLIEMMFYFYFFNGGFVSIERFVVETSFTKELALSTGFLLRQWFVLLYSVPALIDNALVTVMALKLLPYIRVLDDRYPGRIGTLAVSLFFIGGSVIVYFVLFP